MSQNDSIEKLMKQMNVREGGVLIKRFYLKEMLGEGSYGRVYKAIDYQDNTQVAVKLSFGDGTTNERNLIEAEVLDKLSIIDSNLIVQLKTYFVMEECIIMVLEFLPYNLSDIIKSNVFNNMSIISVYAKQMIEFLSLCSRLDLIHCDIKPDNILVDKKSHRIKFADFGLAHCPLVEHKLRKIQTLNYCAPEILLGFDYVSSVDMWSVGCVLMECLTGRLFLFLDLIKEMMQLYPESRYTPEMCMNHPFFKL